MHTHTTKGRHRARRGVKGALIAAALTVLNVIPAASSAGDSVSCLELVKAAVYNEVAANNHSSKHMFRSRKQTPQGSQTRIYVETRDAMAGMTIAYNDQPLSPDQRSAEEGRLAGLLSSPEQLSRKHTQEKETADRTLRILKALPDAFLYENDGEERTAGKSEKEGGRWVRLKFQPNPAYQPPSRVEQVLVGMQGVLVIDPAAKRIAKIDGTLFKEVGFGWGILGHLDKGGHFLIEQQNVGGGWDIAHMSLEFTGKILLFKNLSIKTDEVFTDFRPVPGDTTFAGGVEILKAEEAKLARGDGSEITKTGSRSH